MSEQILVYCNESGNSGANYYLDGDGDVGQGKAPLLGGKGEGLRSD
jgi:hypothetical protein